MSIIIIFNKFWKKIYRLELLISNKWHSYPYIKVLPFGLLILLFSMANKVHYNRS